MTRSNNNFVGFLIYYIRLRIEIYMAGTKQQTWSSFNGGGCSGVRVSTGSEPGSFDRTGRETKDFGVKNESTNNCDLGNSAGSVPVNGLQGNLRAGQPENGIKNEDGHGGNA